MDGIPRRFPARASDYLVDYISDSSDMMIQLELDFGQRLDAERMARATELVLDAEPILGCRLVKINRKLHWERLDKDNYSAFIMAHDEPEYEAFKSSRIDTYSGPQLKVCLWRSSDGDRLLLKVAHQTADMGGVKELSAKLSDIYRNLDNPDYRPEPNIKGSRSLKQALRHLPWYAYPYISVSSLWIELPTFIHRAVQTLPRTDRSGEARTYIHHPIPPDRVSSIVDYGHAHNATINDIFVTASLRALSKLENWDKDSRLRFETTIDLRRYIPAHHSDAIANLSTMVFGWPSLGTDPGQDFITALNRITAITRHGKAHWIGLENLIIPVALYILLRDLPGGYGIKIHKKLVDTVYYEHMPEHCFSNGGPIAPKDVDFGAQPGTVRFLPPTFNPPLPLLFSLTGYNDALTLSAGVYPSQKEAAEKFFNSILNELQYIS
jgi:NRPS condensation-like uncharacterized protein